MLQLTRRNVKNYVKYMPVTGFKVVWMYFYKWVRVENVSYS